MPWDALPSALDLARFQFAFTVVFHFLFPSFTIGLASYLAVLEGLWLWTGRGGRLYATPWFLRWAVAMGPSGLVAVTAGWIVTEAGRQPFTVYGLLRTADSVSPISQPAIAASL